MVSSGWPTPEAGEIVWCRFPHDLLRHSQTHKPRPALVVRVYDDKTPHYVVLVAYGTSQKTDELRSGEFLIGLQDAAAYRMAGLSFPTKFNFRQCVELPYNNTWFLVPPGAPCGQTPKLGILHPSLIRRAHTAWIAAGNVD